MIVLAIEIENLDQPEIDHLIISFQRSWSLDLPDKNGSHAPLEN